MISKLKKVMFSFIIAKDRVAGIDCKGKTVSFLEDVGKLFEHERMPLNC